MVRGTSLPTLALATALFTALPGSAQQPQPPATTVQPGPRSAALAMDAVVTRQSEIDPRNRIDVYVAMPFESLTFQEVDQRYAGSYKITIAIRDSVSRKVIDSVYTRNVVENDYATSRGATGKADNSVRTFTLPPGTYRMDVLVSDLFSRREFAQTRTLTVPNYVDDIPAISTPLLVREIEQRNNRFRITPIVGDVVWDPKLPLYAFFEGYVETSPDTVAFAWTVASADQRTLGTGMGDVVIAEPSRTIRTFVPLLLKGRISSGSYTLSLVMHPVVRGTIDTTARLATVTRPLVIPRSAVNDALSDLTVAIRQLRYVATQAQLDHIQSGPTDIDRQVRFDEFWKSVDPSPSTVRNEAFDLYYQRVQDANQRFKSYSEGWLTDMGMVYIIYGQPTSTDRYTMQNGAATRTVWTYGNGLTFTFDDNTGFGDFRLRTPLPPGAKFVYR